MAPPVRDARTVQRASEVLASCPGGPAPGEARRRLAEGLPLIVGLSRTDTERIQSRLVDLGMIPRIGPAPEGTVPLSATPAHRILPRGRAALLAVLAAAGAAGWFFAAGGFHVARPSPASTPVATLARSPSPGAIARPVETAPPPTLVPPAERLALSARAERGSGPEQLGLVVIAQIRAVEPIPPADLVVSVRAEPDGLLVASEIVPDSRARVDVQIVDGAAVTSKSLVHRLSVSRDVLGDRSGLVVDAKWGAWRSERVPVAVPRAR